MAFLYFGEAYEVTERFLDHGHLQFYKGIYKTPEQQMPALFKCLNLQSLPSWSFIQQFEYETELLSQLQHSHLPMFFEQKEVTDASGERWLCLIQRLLPGQNLQHIYETAGCLPSEHVIGIATQTLRILTALHGAHPAILHLDIKPSNLLQDNTGKVHLIDFGAAIRQGQKALFVGGTPGFSPAEQLSGQPTPKSDLYALGATCIELLSGHSVQSLLAGHRIDFWEHLQCETALKNWIEIMVHPDQDLRFDNANQALEQLQRAVKSYSPEQAQTLNEKALKVPDKLNLSIGVSSKNSIQKNIKKPVLEGYLFLEQKSNHGAISTWTAKTISESPEQHVIIKQLNIPQIENLNAFTQFEREVKNLETLKHPRFPRLLDFIKKEHYWFLIQERLPGISLAQKVQNNWRPDTLEICKLAEAMLDTLVVLHEQVPPLIHRDLQPEHILIDDNHVCYLLGFGGAQQRFMWQNSGGSTRTGSFGYTAPEQYVGQHNAASDLFGLGMCLLYTLRQRSPAIYSWENQQLNLDDLNISEGLKSWFKRITHLDPLQRPASAKDALAAFYPQYEEIKVQNRLKNYDSKKGERLDDLRHAETQYTHRAITQQEKSLELQWKDEPWAEILKKLNLPLPPTLRLKLGKNTEKFELKIPGATQSREPGVKSLYVLMQVYTGCSLFIALFGVFLPVLVLPFILALLSQYLFRKKISPYLSHLDFTLSKKRVEWQHLPNPKWSAQTFKKKQELKYDVESLYFKVTLVPAIFPLSPNYYRFQGFSDQEQTQLVLDIQRVFLLDAEAEWLKTTLNVLKHHFKNTP